MLTAERLREVLHYEPQTGVFTRLVRTSHNMRVGDVAGTRLKAGYIQVGIDGKNYYAHRLAFLYMTGKWPEHEADHRGGDRADNRWQNLRDATRSLNQQNLRAPQRNNSTGRLGVRLIGGKFAAVIYANGKARHLGTFADPDTAHAAYVKAKRALHAGCMI